MKEPHAPSAQEVEHPLQRRRPEEVELVAAGELERGEHQQTLSATSFTEAACARKQLQHHALVKEDEARYAVSTREPGRRAAGAGSWLWGFDCGLTCRSFKL